MLMDTQTKKLISALSDETRLRIFDEIIKTAKFSNTRHDNPAYRGNTIKFLRKKLELAQSTIAHHIDILEGAGLVKRQKQGKFEHLFPVYDPLEKLVEFKKTFEKNQLQRIEFYKIIDLEKSFRKDYFNELISLLENHEYKTIHQTQRGESTVVYISDKKLSQQVYHLVYNPQTQIITIHIQTDGGDSIDKNLAKELVNLIDKYLPTLIKQTLVID